MKVCVAGSRSLEHLSPGRVWMYISEAMQAHCQSVNGYEQITTLIHGGARGIDTLAGECAAARGIEVKVYEARWMRFGKYAGHMRNIEMAADADFVIAIWDGESPGTKDMISFTRTIKKPVYVIEVKE